MLLFIVLLLLIIESRNSENMACTAVIMVAVALVTKCGTAKRVYTRQCLSIKQVNTQ
jgi:hypothetical protein